MTTKSVKKSRVGKLLKEMRESASLGIKSAAPKVAVSYSYLSKVENDHKVPSGELVSRLCELYGSNPEEILVRLGDLPPDIKSIIEQNGKEVFEVLRSMYATSEKRGK